MKVCFMLLATLAFFSAPAFAACEDPQTQLEMNMCSATELEKATRDIGKTYQRLLGVLSPQQRARVRAVQLQWIKSKDLTCEFESSYAEGGSMQPLIRNSCLAEATRSRNKELEQWLELFGP